MPGVNNPIKPTKGSVTARFNDDCKVFVSMSDDTTVEKAVIIDAEGNETDIGGGGGSSDFSTAEVKFLNTAAPSKVYYVKYITTDETLGVVQREEVIGTSEEFATNETVILHDGFYIIPWKNFRGLDDEEMPTATGDIEVDLSKGFIIRGNGTVTCKGSETAV